MLGRLGKGRMLIEMLSDFSRYRELLGQTEMRQIPRNNSYQFQNNFSVWLQTPDLEIEPSKVSGFSLTHKSGEGSLAIRSSLHIGEWIEDFMCVDFAEIVLFDNMGNVNRVMTFDICYSGHKLVGDHFSKDVMSPVFDYEIIA